MVFKNLCDIVLWMKVASALEGLTLAVYLSCGVLLRVVDPINKQVLVFSQTLSEIWEYPET